MADDGTTADPVAARLAEIRERWAKVEYVGLKDHVVPEPGPQPRWLDDVPVLLGALEALAKLAVGWDETAAKLDAMADRAGERGADPMRTALMSARAQAHNDCAQLLRDHISAALLGKDGTDG